MNKSCFRTAILFVVLSTATMADAQIDFAKSYYPSVYAAEIDIIEKSYADALRKYQTAFAAVDQPMSVDIVNAAVCAAMIDSTDEAYDLILELASIGVEGGYIDTFPGFVKVRAEENWNTFAAQYHELRHVMKFDDETRILLDSMHIWDQRFRVMPGSYAVYGDTIRKIDSQNIQLFLAIVETKGFPGERMIGRRVPGITAPGYIVLLHHCQRMSKDENSALFNFADMFTDAVSYGEFDPYTAANLLSMQGKFAPTLGPNSVNRLSLHEMPSVLYREKPYGEYSVAIDQKRLQFGIDTIENYYRKAKFFHTDTSAVLFNFRRYGLVDIFHVDQAMYDQIIKFFEPLVK